MTKQDPTLTVKLLTVIISIVLFILLTEGIVRLLDIDLIFQNRFFVLNRALDYPEIFKKDHDLFWRFRPNNEVDSKFFIDKTYHINSLGLHGTDINAGKEKPRLLSLGNSCTFGWGVNYEQSYIRQLEQMLGGDYEIINGAIPGYTSFQGKRFYNSDLKHLDADIVTVMFAFNDLWAAASQISDRDQEPLPHSIIGVQNLLSRLHIYRILKKGLLSAIEQHPDSLFDRTAPVYRVGPDDYRENMNELVDSILANNARPILLTSPIPSLEKYYPVGYKSGLHAFHEQYNRIMREIASEKNVELVDLAIEFDRYDNLFDDPLVDPIHFNARGHQIAGQFIYDYLMSNK
jgi:lysophospholipase L1-like esterase